MVSTINIVKNRIVRMRPLALVGLVWFSALVGRAADYYVATNGTPGGDATNWITATDSIQEAITKCAVSDTVWVSNGVYDVGGTVVTTNTLTNRVYINKAITVRSANNDPTNTIIKGAWDPDPTNNHGMGPAAIRCVYMNTGSELIGFTLTNGATICDPLIANDRQGGGVWAASTSPIISNCVITGNAAYGGGNPDGGGGVRYCTLYNCKVIGNYSYQAGGGTDQSVCYNCTLAHNYAGSHGGGANRGNLDNCLVISNTAPGGRGGGIYRSASVSNCTLAYNASAASGGGGASLVQSLRNCLVYGNYDGGVMMEITNTIESCTIAGNSRYGLYQLSGGTGTNIILNGIIYSNSTANWQEQANSKFMFTNSCTYPTNATRTVKSF